MKIGSVFDNNRTQAVRLPSETRFGDDVKKVSVRVVGESRILSPLGKTWDDFFLSPEYETTDDFLSERAYQYQDERESF